MALFASVARAKQTKALSNVGVNLLTSLLTSASKKVENYLGTPVITAERTEIHNGRGLRQQRVLAIPITSINQIIITDRAGTKTTFKGSLFLFDAEAGRIGFDPAQTADFDVFDNGFQNISVKYTAGFPSDDIPEDIQEATVQIAMGLYIPTAPANPHIKTHRFSEITETIVGNQMPLITPVIEELLADYKLTRIG